jgi:hypothetical protein
MLDDLRNSAANSYQEPEPEKEPNSRRREPIRLRSRSQRETTLFLGMTPQQRFVVALLLFMMVSVMGALVLIATEKIFF